MQVRELIVVYHTERINTQCGQSVDSLDVKAEVYLGTLNS